MMTMRELDSHKEARKGAKNQASGARPPFLFVSFCVSLWPTSPMKVVVLCSGGMDSVTALYWARSVHDVAAVASFDYGSKHNHRELPFAAEHTAKLGLRHEVIPLEFVNRLFASDLLKS